MSQLPQVGDQFGRYRIDAHIGQGGMGVVLSATDVELDRRVALKVLSAALTGTEEFHQRFQREASVLARLSSPHVIDIYDYGIHDDCPYIATQYVGGGDVGALMAARGPMPPQLGARICAQVADALGDAHRVGVVHRDVKPSNVLLRDADVLDLHAYLCDFGIARAESEGLTVPGSVAGTWSYLSPECGRGEPATVASDVYAVGCLLWATLTGHPPYRGTDVEIALAHQQQDVPQLQPLDDFAAHANAILTRAMAKEPSQRYGDADELRSALLAAAATPTAGAHPVDTPTPSAVPPTVNRGAPHVAAAATPPPPPPSYGGPSQPGSAGSPAPPPPPGAPGAPGAPAAVGSGSGGARSTSRSTSKLPVVLGAAVVVLLVVVGGFFGIRALGGDDDPGPGSDDDTASGPVTGDLDGDGLGDLQVVLVPEVTDDSVTFRLWTAPSDGEGFETPEGQDDPRPDDVRRSRDLGDLDGDGESEVVVIDQATGSGEYEAGQVAVTADLSGGGSVDADLDVPAGTALTATYVDDADGDGLDDLVMFSGRSDSFKVEVRASDGEGGFSEPQSELTVQTAPADESDEDGGQNEVGDYDGDGLADLAIFRTEPVEDADGLISGYETTIRTYRGSGSGFELDSATQSIATGEPSFISFDSGDFDGDGADELVIDPNLSQSTLALQVLDYDGGLQAPADWGAFTPSSQRTNYNGLGVSDVNGDGMDDLINIDAARNEVARTVATVALSGGDSFDSPEVWSRWEAINNAAAVPFVTGSIYP